MWTIGPIEDLTSFTFNDVCKQYKEHNMGIEVIVAGLIEIIDLVVKLAKTSGMSEEELETHIAVQNQLRQKLVDAATSRRSDKNEASSD